MEAAFAVTGRGGLREEGRHDLCRCATDGQRHGAKRGRVVMQKQGARRGRPQPKGPNAYLNVIPKNVEILSDHVEQVFVELRNRDLPAAGAAFEELTTCELAPTERIYSSLIQHFGRFQSQDMVERIFTEAERRYGKLSQEIYNNVVRTYVGTKKIDSVREAYQRMLDAGVRPNGRTFLEMMNLFVALGSTDDIEWAMAEIKRLRVRKDLPLFKAILRYHGFKGDMDSMELAYYDMTDSYGIKPDFEVYNIRVAALANENELDTAEEVIQEMKDRMIRPDEMVYTALVKGHAKQGDLSGVKRVFREMKKHKARPNILTMGPIFRLLAEEKSYDEARFYLREMRIAKLRVNQSIYNAVVSIFVDMGDMRSAIEVVRRMQVQDVLPTSGTYYKLFRNYLDSSNRFADHEAVFADLLEKDNIPEDLYLGSLLLDAYLQNGQLSCAKSLLRAIGRSGRPLQPVLYNVVVAYLGDKGRADEAEQVVKQMRINDYSPNYRSYAPLVRGYADLGDVQAVERLLKEMRTQRLFVRASLRSSMRSAKKRDNSFETLTVLLREMDAELIQDMIRWRLIPKKRIRKMLTLKRERDNKVWKLFEDHQRQYSRLVDSKDGELFEVERYRETPLFEFGERDTDLLAQRAAAGRKGGRNVGDLVKAGLIDQSTKSFFVDEDDDDRPSLDPALLARDENGVPVEEAMQRVAVDEEEDEEDEDEEDEDEDEEADDDDYDDDEGDSSQRNPKFRAEEQREEDEEELDIEDDGLDDDDDDVGLDFASFAELNAQSDGDPESEDDDATAAEFLALMRYLH